LLELGWKWLKRLAKRGKALRRSQFWAPFSHVQNGIEVPYSNYHLQKFSFKFKNIFTLLPVATDWRLIFVINRVRIVIKMSLLESLFRLLLKHLVLLRIVGILHMLILHMSTELPQLIFNFYYFYYNFQ
jgi:hypothetical protein